MIGLQGLCSHWVIGGDFNVMRYMTENKEEVRLTPSTLQFDYCVAYLTSLRGRSIM